MEVLERKNAQHDWIRDINRRTIRASRPSASSRRGPSPLHPISFFCSNNQERQSTTRSGPRREPQVDQKGKVTHISLIPIFHNSRQTLLLPLRLLGFPLLKPLLHLSPAISRREASASCIVISHRGESVPLLVAHIHRRDHIQIRPGHRKREASELEEARMLGVRHA